MVRALLTAVAVAACASPHAAARQPASPPAVLAALAFGSARDAETFHAMALKAHLPAPDPRQVARELIRQHLDIDGDDYTVAHFATAADRLQGKPDHVASLTVAMMDAFPGHSRHHAFAKFADALGGLNAGGNASPNIVSFVEGVVHSGSAGEFFGKVGRFLWSKTGPGYVYNTFFADGNVIDTYREDARPLDEAFAIYRTGGFTADHASPWRLSQLVDMFSAPGVFAELPYVKKLDDDLARYWDDNRADWPVLARSAFVHQAKHARDTHALTPAQFRLVMKAGAPRVPLDGPVTLEQLRKGTPDGSVKTYRFDINGYSASDLVRFVDDDGSEVMYIPGGDSAFVAAKSTQELWQWVLEQAKEPGTRDALLSHFSIYDSQDGSFRTGVRQALENIGNGTWKADDGSIDHGNLAIAGDVFADMGTRMEGRTRDDARMQAATAWDAWRTRINRTASLLAPLGYIPVLAIPIQVGTGLAGVGTGVDQAFRGRTAEERKGGLEQAALTVLTNVPIGAAFGGKAHGAGEVSVMNEEGRPFFHPPGKVHDRPGYALSPTTPPKLPLDGGNRLYLRQDGTLARWAAQQAQRHAMPVPVLARLLPDGTFTHDGYLYGAWGAPGRSSAIRLIADGVTFRMLLDDGTVGPVVKQKSDSTWDLAVAEDGYVEGSVLAHMLPDYVTTDAEVLHRAAQILKQFGSTENILLTLPSMRAGATPAGPMVMVAVGHAFIETLPARLRDPAPRAWSAMELRLMAPVMVERTGVPLAVFSETGELVCAVLADGSEATPELLPETALRLRRQGDGYVLLDRNLQATQRSTRSVFAAMEERTRPHRDEQDLDEVRLERDFRSAIADSIDARSTRPELERMHRLWIDPMRLPTRQKRLTKDLSVLRHALVDRHETLSPAQTQVLLAARIDPDGVSSQVASIDMHATTDGVLARIADRESALLPGGLDYLRVKDHVILELARGQVADDWTTDDRDYVRLRHLDGRMQIVETGAGQVADAREILEPGSGANRRTGRWLVRTDGMWYPEKGLREGFALVDPKVRSAATETIARTVPASLRWNHEAIARIVDSIPPPLLRFFETSLVGVDVAPDGELVLEVQHVESGRYMTYPTHIDSDGWFMPGARAKPMPGQSPLAFADDRQLVLPVLRGTRHGAAASVPNPDVRTYLQLLRSERPLSEIVALGLGDRHVGALATARRLRAMLREDAHAALVAATPDHVLTLILPVGEATVRWAGSERSRGRFVGELPDGTVIVDNMYEVSVPAKEYPARVRQIALAWEASGNTMTRVRPDGREETESPVTFTERLLATPLQVNLWNPKHDPISERRYVEYLHRRHVNGLPVRRAGLEWLTTPEARRDYMTYFAPPYNILPFGKAPPTASLAASRMRSMVDAAIEAGLKK